MRIIRQGIPPVAYASYESYVLCMLQHPEWVFFHFFIHLFIYFFFFGRTTILFIALTIFCSPTLPSVFGPSVALKCLSKFKVRPRWPRGEQRQRLAAYRIIGSNVGCHFLLPLLVLLLPRTHSADAGKTLVSDLNGAQLCSISWTRRRRRSRRRRRQQRRRTSGHTSATECCRPQCKVLLRPMLPLPLLLLLLLRLWLVRHLMWSLSYAQRRGRAGQGRDSLPGIVLLIFWWTYLSEKYERAARERKRKRESDR